MTRDDRPEPPATLDRTRQQALRTLERCDPERLRTIAGYLEELAAWKEASTDDEPVPAPEEPSEGSESTEIEEGGIDYPDDVPECASVTVKEIAGTTYYYYQWREGDRIESKTVQR